MCQQYPDQTDTIPTINAFHSDNCPFHSSLILTTNTASPYTRYRWHDISAVRHLGSASFRQKTFRQCDNSAVRQFGSKHNPKKCVISAVELKVNKSPHMILKGDISVVNLNFKKQIKNLRRNLVQNLHKILKGGNSAVNLIF